MNDGWRLQCIGTLKEFTARGKALLNVLASLHIRLYHFNDLFLLLFVAMNGIVVSGG